MFVTRFTSSDNFSYNTNQNICVDTFTSYNSLWTNTYSSSMRQKNFAKGVGFTYTYTQCIYSWKFLVVEKIVNFITTFVSTLYRYMSLYTFAYALFIINYLICTYK